ncbi:hypothetical protein DBR37_04640 [Herminiimonas sp. KBW02]|uniref:DUF932 domain-containing protein n=1 Tax=Herminiimonas glaciei TaxID=523788 RepID=A0ABW2I698_9BURK|nr:DUF932 domain-containing protein [Herminiimonas sp. KBW02]RQO35670.1 hypothetical protein DBR37_04640 [Herminiimonas sp. KBW02]
MSHEIETMAFTGETPWHGLGKALTPNQPLNTWARQSGLDFKIMETPVRFNTGLLGAPEKIQMFSHQKVLYRSDTNAALSVVSNRYQVVQPDEILEFYRDLTERSGFELETAGVMKGGRKLWALAKTGQSFSIKAKDRINGYLLLATACDGSLATTAQFTSVRVVCNNTLAIALSGGKDVVKVPHSTTFEPELVKKELGISFSAWDNFRYRMNKLAERKIKDQEVNAFLHTLFSLPFENNELQNMGRTMRQIKRIYEGKGRGAELPSAKGTAFGLLQAVTEFVDHERRAKSIDHRLDSAWFGQGAALKAKALWQTTALLE